MNRAAPLLPAVVGLVAGAIALAVAPAVRIRVAFSPALALVVIGLLVTAAWIVAVRRRGRTAAAVRSAVDGTRAADAESRRRFVARLDHELKNPLTALLAALGGEPGLLPAPERALAIAQADRIRRLLTDLRRVADVEVVPLETDRVDVAETLREAVDLAVEDAGGDREVRVDVPAAPWPVPAVRGDADLLVVAVLNVVANALKYSGPADVIEVRAREAGDTAPTVTIEVADTGPGIPDEHQAAVWEELARGAAPAGVPGSGIGLALVRTIVHRHGGTTELRSRAGEGTSVLLHLPAER